ncbi:LytR/AlgR family response regulator transcription factor [Sphingobacterium thalpophilum]|uniref:LytR/AlgR family response regulator transcription factor n=1 Tax=Sphingobacterium thalpophilum TaxID=259 RepID=UPI003C718963
MIKIKCAIVEDELPASDLLELHISKFDFLDLKGKYTHVGGLQELLATEQIDLLFLDINLPGKSGIEFAKSLPKETAIIFTTAYPNYAVEGFELDAIDYILKPISLERFTKAVNKYSKTKQINTTVHAPVNDVEDRAFIFVKCERKMMKFFLDEIDYLESQGNYVIIYTLNGPYKIYQSITDMQDRLPEGTFLRIHRSFLVAINKITSFGNKHIHIRDKQLPIGRFYHNEVADFLTRLASE